MSFAVKIFWMDLRDRLRALKTSPSTPETPGPVKPLPLPYLLSLQNEFGETCYLDKIYIEHHGQIDLKNFPQLSLETLRFLTVDHSLSCFDTSNAVFLDIETTGTAGGTGTYAFLVGLGFQDQGYFQIRQFFLHDLSQESAFLRAIAEFTGRFRHLITYNGKVFDSQILRNRYLMHRAEDPLEDKEHIDMLFVARRLWKRKFGECDLVNLEKNILQFHRADDIPSYLIPGAYVDYLRYASSSLIHKVIHHNQLDILSLAVLTARACQMLNDESELSAEEHFSLSLLHERQKNYSKAIEHQRLALRMEPRFWRSVLLAFARNLRRMKDHDQMKWLLQYLQNEPMEEDLCRQLCIICEHDLKDYELALRLMEPHLQKMDKFRFLSTKLHSGSEDWEKRRIRLERKLSRSVIPVINDPINLHL
jgi:uncharacterized protein YprB with RNaseH-like and TPR domain